MENKKAHWKTLKLSVPLAYQEAHHSLIQTPEELVIVYNYDCKYLSKCDSEIKFVFKADEVISYRKARLNDMLGYLDETFDDKDKWIYETEDVGLLGWLQSFAIYPIEGVKGYKFCSDSDDIEVVSYSPPKIYYRTDVFVEEEEKDK